MNTEAPQTREGELYKGIDAILAVASLLLLALLALAYWFLWSLQPPSEGQATAISFALAVIPNLVPTVLAFLAGYALFRRIEHLKAEYEKEKLVASLSDALAPKLRDLVRGSLADELVLDDDIGRVPWPELIRTSKNVDFCVQGWETWVSDHWWDLKDLFDRGGRVRGGERPEGFPEAWLPSLFPWRNQR